MKKNFLIFLCLILLPFISYAQQCSETMLMQKTGIWKEGLKGSVTGINASDLAKEKAIVASIHTMIQANYSPMGLVADFSCAFERPYPNMPVNSYSYNILFRPYYCEGNMIKTAHETSTSLQIGVNTFDAEIYDSYGDDTSEGKGFHSMEDMPSEKDGFFYFKEKNVNLGFGMTGKNSTWLISCDGKLPYAYVSKQAFLMKRKQLLARDLPSTIASLRESLKMNELTKTQLETEYKSDPERLKRYLKNTYLFNKEKYEKGIIKSEQEFNNAFAGIEILLKMSASELEQPAIVRQDPHDYLSYQFTTDDDPFGRVLIQPNPAYFNEKLPRAMPQFIMVNVVGDTKNQITAKAIGDIIKAIDFAALKKMVDR